VRGGEKTNLLKGNRKRKRALRSQPNRGVEKKKEKGEGSGTKKKNRASAGHKKRHGKMGGGHQKSKTKKKTVAISSPLTLLDSWREVKKMNTQHGCDSEKSFLVKREVD